MAPVSYSKNHCVTGVLLLVATCLLANLQVASSIPIPRFTGREAYNQLEEYLQAKGKPVDDVEGNLRIIEELTKDDDVDKSLRRTAELVFAMKVALDEGSCKHYDINYMIKMNTIGAGPEDEKLKFDHPEHLKESRLATIISQMAPKILVNCEKFLQTRLDEADELFQEKMLARFKAYWSKDMIEEYSEHSTRTDPKLGVVSWDLLSTKPRDFELVPIEVMLNQIFNVAREDLMNDPDIEVEYKGNSGTATTVTWKRISEVRLAKLVERHIMDPCEAHTYNTQWNLLGAYYIFRANYIRTPTGVFDLDKMVANQAEEFRYQLFRYEFCHKYGVHKELETNMIEKYKQMVMETSMD